MKLETYTGFNPDKMANYFSNRGWPVETIPVQQVELVPLDEGASLECGDGRFDKFVRRKKHGVRILGGINAVMAMLTGGDEKGLNEAVLIISKLGFTPGTHGADHGGCGYADLWIAGQLESAVHPYDLHNARGSLRVGKWLKDEMRKHGGAHIKLNGNHEEEAVRLNPFSGYTEFAVCGSRFRIDDHFMADLGIPDQGRFLKIAESIEKLKPNAAKLEIIVP